MSKIAVVYWSGTGNTEIMANKIAEGVKLAGNEASIFTPSDFSADMVSGFDAIAFGCPSMGAEMLEDGEFEPMYDSVKSNLSGKKVAIFGSYGWGDGEWIRNWEDDIKGTGANLVCEPLMLNETPDSDGENDCIEFGKKL